MSEEGLPLLAQTLVHEHTKQKQRARSTSSSELEPPAFDTSVVVRFERTIAVLTSMHTARAIKSSGQACQTSNLTLTNSRSAHRPRA